MHSISIHKKYIVFLQDTSVLCKYYVFDNNIFQISTGRDFIIYESKVGIILCDVILLTFVLSIWPNQRNFPFPIYSLNHLSRHSSRQVLLYYIHCASLSLQSNTLYWATISLLQPFALSYLLSSAIANIHYKVEINSRWLRDTLFIARCGYP